MKPSLSDSKPLLSLLALALLLTPGCSDPSDACRDTAACPDARSSMPDAGALAAPTSAHDDESSTRDTPSVSESGEPARGAPTEQASVATADPDAGLARGAAEHDGSLGATDTQAPDANGAVRSEPSAEAASAASPEAEAPSDAPTDAPADTELDAEASDAAGGAEAAPGQTPAEEEMATGAGATDSPVQVLVDCDATELCSSAPLECAAHCLQCELVTNQGCSPDEPLCLQLGDDVACVACDASTNLGCGAAEPVCVPGELGLSDADCRACDAWTHEGCAGVAPYCEGNGERGGDRCVECLTDQHCGADSPVCLDGTCVECATDAECSPSAPHCVDQQCECSLSAAELANDPNNCGACGNVCNLANAASECVAGECVVAACSPNFGSCNQDDTDGCELAFEGPSIPALSSLLVGSYSGSLHASEKGTLRPTFTWQAGETCGSVSYQIQIDDACRAGVLEGCAFSNPQVDEFVTETSFRPSEDLEVSHSVPVGALTSWRVRACDDSTRCSAWSPVRYLHVGRVKEDVNGDGYGDIIGLTGMPVHYEIFAGSPSHDFDKSNPVITQSGSWYPAMTTDGRFAGDVNADGFGDWVYQSFGVQPYSTGGVFYEPRAHVIYGSADIRSQQLTVVSGSFAQAVGPAGDVNGDGFADVALVPYDDRTDEDDMWDTIDIYAGATSRSLTKLSSELTATFPDDVFPTLAEVGDLDGDALPDIAFVAHGLHIRFSTKGNFYHYVDKLTSGSFAGCRAGAVAGVGDFNRDGFGDFGMSCPELGRNYVYLGAAAEFARQFHWQSEFPAGSVVGGVDLNADGYDEVFFPGAEAAILVWSSPLPSGYTRTYSGLAGYDNASVTDLDGDHEPDIVYVTPGRAVWMTTTSLGTDLRDLEFTLELGAMVY